MTNGSLRHRSLIIPPKQIRCTYLGQSAGISFLIVPSQSNGISRLVDLGTAFVASSIGTVPWKWYIRHGKRFWFHWSFIFWLWRMATGRPVKCGDWLWVCSLSKFVGFEWIFPDALIGSSRILAQTRARWRSGDTPVQHSWKSGHSYRTSCIQCYRVRTVSKSLLISSPTLAIWSTVHRDPAVFNSNRLSGYQYTWI